MEPSDLDGYELPPAGAPNNFFAAGGYQLRSIFEDDGIYTYKFHVDFDGPVAVRRSSARRRSPCRRTTSSATAS